jgi:polyisoprenoid-binding protein YceI
MSTTSTAVQAPPAGRYAIDPVGSSVTFATRHMFGLGKVRGRLR